MGDFPAWVRTTHWINVLFIVFLMRAGIQIWRHTLVCSLYWNDHCAPGTEWLTLTGRKIVAKRPWTALEQEEEPTSGSLATRKRYSPTR